MNGSHIKLANIREKYFWQGALWSELCYCYGEAKVHDASLAAMGTLITPRVEFALRSTNVCWVRDPSSFVFESGQRDFSLITEGLHLTVSCRSNSNAYRSRIDETRVNNTVNVGVLSVFERDFDPKTTHAWLEKPHCLQIFGFSKLRRHQYSIRMTFSE